MYWTEVRKSNLILWFIPSFHYFLNSWVHISLFSAVSSEGREQSVCDDILTTKYSNEGSIFALLVCLTRHTVETYFSWNSGLYCQIVFTAGRPCQAPCCVVWWRPGRYLGKYWCRAGLPSPQSSRPPATRTHQYSLMTVTSKKRKLDAKWTQYILVNYFLLSSITNKNRTR